MKYFIILLILLYPTIVSADKIPTPPPMKDTELAAQQYFRTLYLNFHNLEVITTTPNGNRTGRVGDIVLFNDGGTFKLFVNTTGVKVWQQL